MRNYNGEISLNTKEGNVVLKTSEGHKFIKHFLTESEKKTLITIGGYVQDKEYFNTAERGYSWAFIKNRSSEFFTISESNPVYTSLLQTMNVVLRGTNTLEDFKSILN